MVKTCSKCKVERPIDDFCRRTDRPGFRKSQCRICENLTSKDWYQRNREDRLAKKRADWAENSSRITRHGLTKEQYDNLHTAQQGRCAWCGRNEEALNKELYIDHDKECCPGQYSCGKCVRRLLCRTCNTMEGWLGDTWPVALKTLNDIAYYKGGLEND
jgi:hypothetical protein